MPSSDAAIKKRYESVKPAKISYLVVATHKQRPAILLCTLMVGSDQTDPVPNINAHEGGNEENVRMSNPILVALWRTHARRSFVAAGIINVDKIRPVYNKIEGRDVERII